jgi:hypothetical protein
MEAVFALEVPVCLHRIRTDWHKTYTPEAQVGGGRTLSVSLASSFPSMYIDSWSTSAMFVISVFRTRNSIGNYTASRSLSASLWQIFFRQMIAETTTNAHPKKTSMKIRTHFLAMAVSACCFLLYASISAWSFSFSGEAARVLCSSSSMYRARIVICC